MKMEMNKANFKPGDRIALTITFDEPVDPQTTLTIEYVMADGAGLKDQATFQKWFLLNLESTVSERRTIVFSTTVTQHQASGNYGTAIIAAEHPGERRQEVPLNGAPPIQIDNPERDEKIARIPGIKSIATS